MCILNPFKGASFLPFKGRVVFEIAKNLSRSSLHFLEKEKLVGCQYSFLDKVLDEFRMPEMTKSACQKSYQFFRVISR